MKYDIKKNGVVVEFFRPLMVLFVILGGIVFLWESEFRFLLFLWAIGELIKFVSDRGGMRSMWQAYKERTV